MDVIRSHPQRLRLAGASTNRQVNVLREQIAQFSPDWVHISDQHAAAELKSEAGISADQMLSRVHAAEVVVSAIVGAAGLEPTWAAVDGGARVALANQESLVVAGHLMTARAAETGARLLPVDRSEEHTSELQSQD